MAGGFVAVGHDGLRLSSPDGLAWGEAQRGREGEVYRAAAWGNGRFVAVGTFGGDNVTASSADGGATWKTGKREAKYSDYFLGLFFVGGRFVALGGDAVSVGAAKPFFCSTEDGERWGELERISGKFLLRRIAFGNGLWVGVGDRGRRAWSLDGKEWQDVPGTKPVDTLVDVAFGNGVFVGTGLHGLRAFSRDGKAWSERIPGEEGEHINTVLFAGGRFVGVGLGATYLSPDGEKWERRPNRDAPLTAAYGAGRFVGAHWKGRLLVSEDAVIWRQVHKAPHHVEAVAFGG